MSTKDYTSSILAAFKDGRATWSDIMDSVAKNGPPPPNGWMAVRSDLQKLLNQGTIMRDSGPRIESYTKEQL